jgi:hypothetical protein
MRTLLAVAAALALTIVGRAEAAARYSCEFQGGTTSMTPMFVLGGSGNWTGQSVATCVVNNGTSVSYVVFGWTSNGSYSNTECGTFTMDGIWSGPGSSRTTHVDVVEWNGRIVENGQTVGTMHFRPRGTSTIYCATGLDWTGSFSG